MIARTERRVPVRIARQRGTNVLLGRVSLKFCLNAVCCASPELLLDKSTDYIVYAVDPEESPRPTSALASPRRSTGSQVFVGKGFFSGGLEEPGDGTSHVTGHVRTEARNSSAFSSDEEEASGTDVLEIVLRLKEASQRGREQYQHRMRGMASTGRAPSPGGVPKGAEPSSSSRSSSPPVAAPVVASPPPSSSQASAQVLQVLQAMQAHQGSLTSEQQTHLLGLLGMVAGAMQSGAIPTPHESATPPAHVTPKPSQSESKSARAHRPGLRDTRTELPRICYNCGTRHATTWRILTLPAGVTVHHPASERPPSDAVPLTWTPQYGDQGPIETHSEARWQACNPCGLYFAKYGVARPDYVRNFVARPNKEEKKRDTQAKALPERPKRAKNAVDTPRSSLARTLSAVANRDAERLQQRRDENVPPTQSPPPALRSGVPLAASYKSPRRMARPSAFTSPSAGFGISSAVMNSSPNTVLNTLMSEADMDLEERQAMTASPRRHSLPKVLSSPVRRSPRKQPPGTVADVNPYASAARSASSPMPKKARIERGRDALTSPARMLPPVNPFMGLGMMDEEADMLGGPPSPSAGRTSRAKPAPKREARTPSRLPTGEAWQASVPSPTTLGLDEALPLSLSESAPGMKELFADPAPWMAVWEAQQDAPPAASTDAAVPEAPAPEATSQALTEPPMRRPRPATVEDASSTPSGSPVGSPEEESLVDLIEDPYGLLSACGLGVLPGAVNESGDTLAVSERTGSNNFSADAFNGIELHGAPAFAQHLEAFTQSGGLGVAAHMGAPREADVAALPGPHVKSFGHAAKPADTAGTDLEAFLDDPTVQAMLTNLNEVPSHGSAPLLTS
ncbi:hypothetical protein MEQU1_001193 [Malassezia equina]|uniref:Ams2/SPT21 N-terminal domain-containing protein n=1 Tax=Malassezia equina TaxID=1381935 RepID=A0AAF0IY56_9BASI|nr:hypothetical protein MEQU1_001193 [Malassezia equina]